MPAKWRPQPCAKTDEASTIKTPDFSFPPELAGWGLTVMDQSRVELNQD
jgi:hypothetical protein